MSVHELRELKAGTRWPDFDTYERICELFGWPQAFVWDSAASTSPPPPPARLARDDETSMLAGKELQ